MLKKKRQPHTTTFKDFDVAKDSSGGRIVDQRSEALNAFKQYRRAVDACTFQTTSDNMRAPIAVNSGTTGSGKTVQLFLICDHFETETRGRAVYFSFNGKNASSQEFDKHMPVETRVAHRILLAATQSTLSPASFWAGVRDELGMVQASDFQSKNLKDPKEYALTNHDVVLDVCRQVLDIDDTVPLLIAADELAKLSMPDNTVGELNEKAVAALKCLAGLSDASVRRKSQRLSQNLPPSALCYIAASAYAAYNPARGVTAGSNRPVSVVRC